MESDPKFNLRQLFSAIEKLERMSEKLRSTPWPSHEQRQAFELEWIRLRRNLPPEIERVLASRVRAGFRLSATLIDGRCMACFSPALRPDQAGGGTATSPVQCPCCGVILLPAQEPYRQE